MEPPQGLNHGRHKDNAFPLAGLVGVPALLGERLSQGVTRVFSRLSHSGGEKRADNRDVQGSVSNPGKVWYEDISRPISVAWEESLLLLPGGQVSTGGRLEDGVTEVVVSRYPLAFGPTDDGMVTIKFAVLATGWTGPTGGAERGTQSVEDEGAILS